MFPFSGYLVVTDEDVAAAAQVADVIEAVLAPPEIPPPCWDSRAIDPEACAAATRALCG